MFSQGQIRFIEGSDDISNDLDLNTLTIEDSIKDEEGNKKLDFENNKTSFNRTFTSQITFKDDFSTISDPAAGCIAYDSNNDILKIYDGSSWQDVGGNISIDGGEIEGAIEVDSLTVKAGNLTVINSGNLGVGKSNPAEKIDVVGNIKASGDIHGDKLIADNDIEGKNLTIDETIQGEKLIATDDIETKDLNVNGEVKGQIKYQTAKTDTVSETLRPYVNDQPQGLIYLSFEDPQNLGKDFSSNEWDGVAQNNVSYISNVEDNNGVTMKHVARIQGTGFNGFGGIHLDDFADHDHIRCVSFWFRSDTPTGSDYEYLFRLGRGDTGSWEENHWYIRSLDGNIDHVLRRGSTTPRARMGVPAETKDIFDGNWHFFVAAPPSPALTHSLETPQKRRQRRL